MKRLMILLISCIIYCNVSAQFILSNENINGIYTLESGELFIYNFENQKLIEHKILTDTTTVDPNEFHLGKIFREITFVNGDLNSCVLADGNKYRINDFFLFQPFLTQKDRRDDDVEYISGDYVFDGAFFPSVYFDIDGDYLKVTFPKSNFGQSDVKFTMSTELILKLKKNRIQ